MNLIKSIYAKAKFDFNSDRLGPDCPFTHWKLYFAELADEVCKSKFKCFGSKAQFRPGAYAVTCSKISIGNFVVIRPGSMLFAFPGVDVQGEIIIEDKVLIGSSVHIYTSNHKFDDLSKPIFDQGHESPKSVTIRCGAWIGANSIILPGVEVGVNSVVAAGSVVTKNVAPFTLAAGVPAKVVRILA